MDFGTILPMLLSPQLLIAVFFGVAIGVIVGALPGLNGANAISLMLPITFVMPPEVGLSLLGGIYMGCMYGGSITAILMNVPGEVVAAPVAMEGYPMAKEGRSREALYYSIFASTIGGFAGVIVLILFTPPLASFALKFGPAEMFFVGLSGLIIVGALGGSMVKGIFATAVGLFVSTIGVDPATGVDRFTFGIPEFRSGISVVPVVLGLFCITEMLERMAADPENVPRIEDRPIRKIDVFKDVLKHRLLLMKSIVLGTVVGLLPGVGATLSVFVAYAEAKRSSRRPDLFERGNAEGIIAAECSNNATVGTSLVPLLALGVPGSPTSAIMTGALMIHGIVLGPSLFVNRPDVAYTFLGAMLLSVVAMAIIGIYCIGYFSYILKIRSDYITPAVLVFAIIGAYSVNNSMFDVWIAIGFGLMGILFNRFSIPMAPVIIGVVLGPLIESSLSRAITIANARQLHLLEYLLSSTLSLVLLAVVFLLILVVLQMRRRFATIG